MRLDRRLCAFALVTASLSIGCSGSGNGAPTAPFVGGTIASATPAASASGAAFPGASASPVASASATASAAASARPSASASPSSSTSPTAAPTATPSASSSATMSPIATAAPTAIPSPTAVPTIAAVRSLWALVGATVVEFNAAQIPSGTVTPIHQFSVLDASYPLYYGIAFDRLGDLWVVEGNLNIAPGASNYTGRVLEFSAAQLAVLTAVPNPVPIVTLTLGGAGYGVAFDASGNLWASVTSFANGGFVAKYTPAQIVVSGMPTPGVVVSSLNNPAGLTFGSDGTLWFTPNALFGPSNGVISGLSPTQLANSGSPTPAYQLNGNAPQGILGGQLALFLPPNEVQFDGSGNIWSIFNGYAFEYAASALHGPGTTPTIGFQMYPAQSTATGQTTTIPGYAIAFDSANDLIANSTNNNTAGANVLKYFTPAQYGAAAPIGSSANFTASVPGSNGTNIGNYVIAGPYVP